MLHLPQSWALCDNSVGWMVRLEGGEEELAAAECEAIADREDLGLRMQMVNSRHFDCACGNAEGQVLDNLKFGY